MYINNTNIDFALIVKIFVMNFQKGDENTRNAAKSIINEAQTNTTLEDDILRMLSSISEL